MNLFHLPKIRKPHQISFLFLLCALLFSGCNSKSPREVIEEAVRATFQTSQPFEEELGLSKLRSALSSGAYGTELAMTLQRLELPASSFDSGKLEGLGFSMASILSPDEKKWIADLNVNYANTLSLNSFVSLEQSKLSVCIPRLLDNSFFIDLSTLGADLSGNSLAAEALSDYISLPENFSVDPWTMSAPLQSLKQKFSSEADAGINAKLCTYKNTLCEQMVYQKLKRNDPRLPKESTARHYYSITIPATALRDFLSDLLNLGYKDLLPDFIAAWNESVTALGGTGLISEAEFSDRAQIMEFLSMLPDFFDDPVLLVGIDKKGIISHVGLKLNVLEHPFLFDLKVKNSGNGQKRLRLTYSDDFHHSVSCDLTITATTQLSEYELQLDYADSENACSALVQFELDRTTKEFAFLGNVTEGATVLFSVSAEGLLSDIQKGDHFTAVFHYFDVDLPELFSVSVSGSVGIFATPKAIVFPSGKNYRVFGLTRLDLLFLGTNLSANIKKDPVLSQLLELLQ